MDPPSQSPAEHAQPSLSRRNSSVLHCHSYFSSIPTCDRHVRSAVLQPPLRLEARALCAESHERAGGCQRRFKRTRPATTAIEPFVSGACAANVAYPSGFSTPPSAGNLAERVFQSANPNCRATISRHALWERETFRSARETRRDFAMVLAFFCVNYCLILHSQRTIG
jgi:hypothetical protein